MLFFVIFKKFIYQNQGIVSKLVFQVPILLALFIFSLPLDVRHNYSCDYRPVSCSTNANPTLDRYSGWQGMNTKLKCGTTSKSGIQARRPGMPSVLLTLLRVRDLLLMQKALRILF
jgi:hypothetical protein